MLILCMDIFSQHANVWVVFGLQLSACVYILADDP